MGIHHLLWIIIQSYLDLGSIPQQGRASVEGKGYRLQDSGLENSMEKSVGLQRVGHAKSNFHSILLFELLQLWL